MILWRAPSDDLFAETTVDVLVNPVNCVGVSGKGLAMEFKKRFPAAQLDYERACVDGRLTLGQVLLTPAPAPVRFIAFLPTKTHWRVASELAHVDGGLASLVREVRRRRIRSLAIPALGCGYGGLRWRDVKPVLVRHLAPLEDVTSVVFPPHE
jgi:O-acetyl-ADP-ribose deacetylase (regulator of RNase III)